LTPPNLIVLAASVVGRSVAALSFGRTMIRDVLRKMSPVKAHGARSGVGHCIAGTAGAEEFSKVLDELN
jgi:hypothetical protein